MAATSATVTVYEQDTGLTQEANSPFQYKEIIVYATNVADDGDTIAITLADYGITTFKTIKGYSHTTEGSVIVEEAPTTSVTAGVLTITVGGATDNLARAFLVGGI